MKINTLKIPLNGSQWQTLDVLLERLLSRNLNEVRSSVGEYLVHANLLELYAVVSATYRQGRFSGLWLDSKRTRNLTFTLPRALALYYVLTDLLEAAAAAVAPETYEHNLFTSLQDAIYQRYFL